MRLYHILSTAALATLAAAQSKNKIAFTSTSTSLQVGFSNTPMYNAQSMSIHFEGSSNPGANTSTSSTASIANLPAMMPNNNASIANFTAPPTTSKLSMTAAPVVGSGISMGNSTIMSRNQTMSSGSSSGAALPNSGASSTVGGAAVGGVSTASSTQARASSTSSAGAAVGSMNVGGGSTLALVLAAVAMIVL